MVEQDDLLATDLRRVSNGASTTEAAGVYSARGWAPVPLQGKDPSVNGADWQDKTYDAAAFDGLNIGLRLGPISRDLTDIDLDCDEARALASVFLPPTGLKHGRQSAPDSHWWYIVRDAFALFKCRDIAVIVDGKRTYKTLLELRSSTGAKALQTMVPPSVHPNGEKLKWSSFGDAVEIPYAVLLRQVKRLAAATLLARHFPGIGGRHDTALALAGVLLRHGFNEEDAHDFVFAVCLVGGSENPEKHAKVVHATAIAIAAGTPTTGLPNLKKFFDAGVILKLVEWLELDRPVKPPPVATVEGEEKEEKLVVRINTNEMQVANQVIPELITRGELYARGNILSHCTRQITDTIDDLSVKRYEGTPQLVATSLPYLREMITDTVKLEKFDKRADDWISSHPPEWLPKAISARGAWPGMSELAGLIEVPTIRSDGTILDTPGFDKQSGLLYIPSLAIPPLIENPTQEDAHNALLFLVDPVCDFPFETASHRSCWVAALISVMARRAIKDPVPMFIIDGNVRGVGKSMLADVISSITCGRRAARMPPSNSDEEDRKRITSIVVAGDALALVDNVTNDFGSSAWDSLLTSMVWKDRILGSTNHIELPNNCVWFVSGNNIRLVGDMIRRGAHIRLVSKLEQPDLRDTEKFKYPHLLEHVLSIRGELVRAVLTVLRAYHLAGCPKDPTLKAWGSFETWTNMVRQAIVWAGFPDPDTREGLRASADNEGELLAQLFEELAKLGDFTTGQLLMKLQESAGFGAPKHATLKQVLSQLISSPDGRAPNAERVGKLLQRCKERCVAGYELRKVGTRNGAPWVVVKLT